MRFYFYENDEKIKGDKMRFKIFVVFMMLAIIPVLFYAEDEKKISDNTADTKEVKENKNSDDAAGSGKVKEKKKAPKKDEKRFQFGLGIFGNSDDFSTMSDNFDRIMAIKHGKNYSYPGYDQERMDSIQSMDKWMQKFHINGLYPEEAGVRRGHQDIISILYVGN